MVLPAITVACEGPTDSAVLVRLLHWLGLAVGPVHIKKGKGQIDKRLRSYNEAAKLAPWLVVRDLDCDAACAPALISKLLPEPTVSMCFRVAVPQIEAWLLADRSGMATFLGVDVVRLPNTPDNIQNAKAELIQLARSSRLRKIREDLVPEPGLTQSVGSGYTARIIEFTQKAWSPTRAENASPSLASCIRALRRLGGGGSLAARSRQS
jgi:hypothetical protein